MPKAALAFEVSVGIFLSLAETDLESLIPNDTEPADFGVGEMLMVRDAWSDVEVALGALERVKMANPFKVVRHVDEALAYLFSTSEYAARRGVPLPELTLLDVMLPKVSGLAVLRRIQSDPTTNSIPMVLLAPSYEDRNIAECARLGAENTPIKAVLFDNLSKVTAWLQLRWAHLKSELSNAPPSSKSAARRASAVVHPLFHAINP